MCITVCKNHVLRSMRTRNSYTMGHIKEDNDKKNHLVTIHLKVILGITHQRVWHLIFNIENKDVYRVSSHTKILYIPDHFSKCGHKSVLSVSTFILRGFCTIFFVIITSDPACRWYWPLSRWPLDFLQRQVWDCWPTDGQTLPNVLSTLLHLKISTCFG